MFLRVLLPKGTITNLESTHFIIWATGNGFVGPLFSRQGLGKGRVSMSHRFEEVDQSPPLPFPVLTTQSAFWVNLLSVSSEL